MTKQILGFIVSIICLTSVYATEPFQLDSPRQEVQFRHLLKDLRCLVCQNQDLADSHSSLAEDLRQQVYTFVKEGKSDDEIIHYLTARYGDFILFKPPVKLLTSMLWFGPAIFLVLGLFIFWRTCLQREMNE